MSPLYRRGRMPVPLKLADFNGLLRSFLDSQSELTPLVYSC